MPTTCYDLRPWADSHRYRWTVEEGARRKAMANQAVFSLDLRGGQYTNPSWKDPANWR